VGGLVSVGAVVTKDVEAGELSPGIPPACGRVPRRLVSKSMLPVDIFSMPWPYHLTVIAMASSPPPRKRPRTGHPESGRATRARSAASRARNAAFSATSASR
jgi:hypothetical protein